MARRIVVRRYVRLPGTENMQDCLYCGEPAESIDHVLPVRFSNWRDDLTPAERAQLVTVPACKECNQIAGARTFHSLREKRDFIRVRLLAKYGKALERPDWNQREIANLGDGLRDYVAASQARKLLANWRLHYDAIPPESLDASPVHGPVDCAVCGEYDWCNPTEVEGEIQPVCGDCWADL